MLLLLPWCLGLIATGMSNLVFLSIVREVNAASLIDRRVGFWTMGLKCWGILKRHRELFPKSNKRYTHGLVGRTGRDFAGCGRHRWNIREDRRLV